MERLEAIEELLKRVERQQEEFKSLEPLLGNVDSILHFDSLFSQYRKKLTDLSHTSIQVADFASSLRSQSSQVTSTATLQAGTRHREIKALEDKTSAVEKLCEQLLTDCRECGQRVVEKMQTEKEGMRRRFEEKLESEADQVKVSLNSEKSTMRTELEQAKAILQASNTVWSKDQGNAFNTVLPQQAGEAGTAALVTNLQAEIEARTKSAAEQLEEQHSSMSSHIQSALHGVSSRLCALQSSLVLSPSLSLRGKHLITCIRIRLDYLYPGLMLRAQACSQLASNLSDRITTIKATEAGYAREIASVKDIASALSTEFESYTKELEGCFDLVTGLETAVQSAVPQERVQLMTRFRSEVKATQYRVKKEKTQREVERALREGQALSRNASALSSSS